MRPSTSLAYNVCSARATTPPRGGSGSHSLRCFDNGQRLAAFAVDHLHYWHCAQSCCSLWGSPLPGQAVRALKTMELCSEPADYTGVSAKHSPTSQVFTTVPRSTGRTPMLQRSDLCQFLFRKCIIIEVSIRLSLQGQKVKALNHLT